MLNCLPSEGNEQVDIQLRTRGGAVTVDRLEQDVEGVNKHLGFRKEALVVYLTSLLRRHRV